MLRALIARASASFPSRTSGAARTDPDRGARERTGVDDARWVVVKSRDPALRLDAHAKAALARFHPHCTIAGRRGLDPDRIGHLSSRFVEYTHECVPLLHGLGDDEEVAVVETLGFGGRIRDTVTAIERAWARASA